jgi:hypothetical protein
MGAKKEMGSSVMINRTPVLTMRTAVRVEAWLLLESEAKHCEIISGGGLP